MLEYIIQNLSLKNRDGSEDGRINEFLFSGCAHTYEGLKSIINDSSNNHYPHSNYLKEKIKLLQGGLRDLEQLILLLEKREQRSKTI